MTSSETPSTSCSDAGLRETSPPCACCGRAVALTFHHLIPRKLHRRTHYRKHYTREQLNRGIMVCRGCHSGIHRYYDEKTLAKEFSSLEALLDDAGLRQHFAWVARQREQV